MPAEVRNHILTICHNHLTEQGIAFISYNTFPGCHLRNMIREMMLFHVRGFDLAEERVRQAQALARFLAEAQDTDDEYRLWMKAELDAMLNHDEGHLYHDDLAEINEPLYFTQFIEQAAEHELQYVGETDYFEMFDHGFKESVHHDLQKLGRNRILREQYLDFLKCRRFRQTLLCHREVCLRTEPQPEKVSSFLVSSAAKCTSDETDLRPGVTSTYKTPKGAKCATDFALGKAALAVLEKNWPMPLTFAEVLQQARTNLTQAGITSKDDHELHEKLSSFLLEIYGAGVVEFRANLPSIARTVSEKPAASAVARWQAQRGNFVTSQFHVAVKVEDELGRCLLSSLDGTMDHNALLEKIWHFLKGKDALALPDGDEAAARRRVKLDLEKNLEKLARLGLLAG